jgi:hypothetical protein
LNNTKKWSWLKAWAMQIANRRGMEKAKLIFNSNPGLLRIPVAVCGGF